MSGWIAWRDAPGTGLARVARVLGSRGPHGWDVVGAGRWTLGLAAGEPGEPGSCVARTSGWHAVASGVVTHLRRLRAETVHRGGAPPEHTPDAVASVAAALGPARVDGRLRGVVAWAAVREDGEGLRAARDGVGVRDVLVAPEGGCVANDARAILASGVSREGDAAALDAWVRTGRWADGATPWRALRRVPPGGTVAWDGDVARTMPGQAFDVQPAGMGGHAGRWARSLGWALALAIRTELEALGCVGASAAGRGGAAGRRPRVAVALGGMSSATVLAAAAAHGGCDLVAVVLDAGDGARRAWAEGVAGAVGARLVAVDADAVGAWDEAARAVEWPLGPGDLAWWMLVRAAGEAGADAFVTGLGARAALELGGSDVIAAVRARRSGTGGLRAQPGLRRAALADGTLPLLERMAGDAGMAVVHPWCDRPFLTLAGTVPVLHLAPRPGGALRAVVAREALGREAPPGPVGASSLEADWPRWAAAAGVVPGAGESLAEAWRRAAIVRWRAAGHGG
ncbi:MAG: Asparagine synthase [Pseudomonadota bacterium]